MLFALLGMELGASSSRLRKRFPRHGFLSSLEKSCSVLRLGGGQQAPVLAAAGADVVSFDLSDEQLRKDLDVAERENLVLR